MCDQAPGIVSCYAGDGNQDGLTFIHGWNDENGTPAVPVVRDVSVLNVNCEDASAPYFLRTGDCDLGLQAVLHFGTQPTFDPETAEVVLDAPGCGNNGCAMAYDGTGAGIGETIWTGFGARFPDDFSGRSTFSIEVTTEFPVGTEHQRTFTGVAHPYVAEPADLQGNQAPPGAGAGPVEYLKLSTLDRRAPTRTRAIRVTRRWPASSSRSASGLRSRSRARSRSLSCSASPARPAARTRHSTATKTYNFQTEIENGCATTYRENYGDWDDDGEMEWSDILCADYPNGIGLPPDTFTPSPPAGLRPYRARRQDRTVPARHQPASEDAELRTQQLAGEPLRLPGLLHRPRLRERSTLRLAGRDRLRDVSRGWKQLSGPHQVLRGLLCHRVGQDEQQPALCRQRAPSLVFGRVSTKSRQWRRLGPLHQRRSLFSLRCGERRPLQLRRGRYLHHRPRRVAAGVSRRRARGARP